MRRARIMAGIIATVSLLAEGSSLTAAPLAFVRTLAAPIGQYPAGIGLADFNSDGKLDVAAANDSTVTTSVLLAAPGSDFNTAISYSNAGGPRMQALPQSLAVADFNGDGILDLAVPNQYGGPFYLSVLLGRSDGTFQPQLPFQVGICPVSIAAGDFNGDGKLDLVTANFDGNTVSVLLSRGDGTFNTYVDYPVGSALSAVAIGDFNGDGKLDILVADYSLNGVSLLLGKGDGTFAASQFTATGNGPRSVAVADLNGDGRLDAVVANGGSNTVSVLRGLGDGSFAPAVNYPTGPIAFGSGYPNAIALADLDGDGRLDIIVANKSGTTLSILRGLTNATFSAPIAVQSGDDPVAVAVADFDGDGRPDLAVLNYSPGTFSLLTNDVLFGADFE